MRRSALGLAVVSALTLAAVASAQEGVGGSWTYGAPIGAGRSAIVGTFGYPGVGIEYLTGLNDRMDLGGFFDFNYGFEGDPSPGGSGVWPGLRLGGHLKYLIAKNGKADISLNFAVAFLAYFPRGDTFIGASLPIPELVIGIPITPVLLINFGFRVPWAIGVLTSASVFAMAIPIQPGAGMEFAIDSKLSFSFNFRVGPIIYDVNGQSQTDAAFDALVGVTYRL